jgi:predicted nucleotidyltransferase
MLTRLFTSKTRIGILKLLLFHQEREFHLREIAKLVGISPSYVAKELDNLSKINLVKKSKRANLSIYSLSRDCVFLDDLKRLFLKTDYLGELVQAEFRGKAKYCFIYGSFAKGDEREGSDIDLFIVSSMKQDDVIGIIRRLERKTDRELNYILWDEKTFKQRRDNHLIKTILSGEIIMLVGDEDELRGK